MGTSEGSDSYQDDGFNVLREDCRRDHQNVCDGKLVSGREQNSLSLWSRSEGFTWSEINGESSGAG